MVEFGQTGTSPEETKCMEKMEKEQDIQSQGLDHLGAEEAFGRIPCPGSRN